MCQEPVARLLSLCRVSRNVGHAGLGGLFVDNCIFIGGTLDAGKGLGFQ